jgi:hypothetical protein
LEGVGHGLNGVEPGSSWEEPRTPTKVSRKTGLSSQIQRRHNQAVDLPRQ